MTPYLKFGTYGQGLAAKKTTWEGIFLMSDQFDFEAIAPNFDDHLLAHLPWYPQALKIAAKTALWFTPKNGTLIDVGCSTGNLESAIQKEVNERRITLCAFDKSPEMVKRYKGQSKPGILDVCDITESKAVGTENAYSYEVPSSAGEGGHFLIPARADCVCVLLSLSFVHPNKKPRALDYLRMMNRKGAAIIILDKYAPEPELAALLHSITWQAKLDAGMSIGEAHAKDESLEGFQWPLAHGDISSDALPLFRYGQFAMHVILPYEW
jgi:SAM-dependent methyltransferase